VRPHPREDAAFWTNTDISQYVSVQPPETTFQEHVNRVRPRLVISWHSTALVDALDLGVIPVSMCEDDDKNVANMVYPLFQRSLRWPRDLALIERLLADDVSYETVLSQLRSC
jgi:hypothetical protein